MIQLPKRIIRILNTLEEKGYSAYCVGGSVRDSLLGFTPVDFDIATSAEPPELCAVFQGYRIIETGIRHGTVTVVAEGLPVEITTYRIDGEYRDQRHPDAVQFTSRIETDLKRRDFTINAMAYHPKTGLLDPYGGQIDLEKGCLRCVGVPAERFSEDALRILRCLRFSAQLGFYIDPDTKRAMILHCSRLTSISAERVQRELTKTLCGKAAQTTLQENAEILLVVIPELSKRICGQEAGGNPCGGWAQTLRAIGAAPADAQIRLALLLGGDAGALCGEGAVQSALQTASAVLSRLRYPKRLQKTVCDLIRFRGTPLPMKRICIKDLLRMLGEQGFFALLAVIRADLTAQQDQLRLQWLERAQAEARAMLEAGLCLRVKQLAVGGGDLLALGFPAGERIGLALCELLDLVLREQIPNEREVLLAVAGEQLRRER